MRVYKLLVLASGNVVCANDESVIDDHGHQVRLKCR